MTYDEQNAVGWCFGLPVVLTIIALLIPAWAISTTGRGANDRVGPKPEGVVQLSRYAYLIQPSARTAPGYICRGSSNNDSPVQTVTDVPALHHSTYVECSEQQHWNTTKRRKPSFGSAIVDYEFLNVAWYAPVAAMWLAFLIYPILVFFRVRKRKRAEKQKITVDLEQKRRELRAAYAKSEINDLEFQTAMDKLYAQGVKPAKDD